MPKHKPQQAQTESLSGKVALITGGAKRIGAALSDTLHAQGMDLVLHYRSSGEAARKLQAELNARRKNSCILIQCELTEFKKLSALIEESVRQAGRLDVLINNASLFYPTPTGAVTEEQWNRLLDTNLKAPYFLAQAAAPHLRKNRGSIINLADIYAQRPLPDHAVYSASKAGLVSLTQSLAQTFAPEIRVNAIAPGAILWPEKQQDEVAQKRLLSRTPLRRAGEPADIARAALYLIRDAAYTTGQVLAVDGGRSTMP